MCLWLSISMVSNVYQSVWYNIASVKNLQSEKEIEHGADNKYMGQSFQCKESSVSQLQLIHRWLIM